MEVSIEKFNHYIVVDESNKILSGWSDGMFPDRDTSGAVLLREDGSYQFRLFPGGEENPLLTNEYGVCLYTYADGKVIPVSDEEVERQTQEIIKNQQEEIKNQEAQKEKEKSLMHQVRAAMSFAVVANTNLSDGEALQIPDLFPVWPSGVNPEGYYIKGQVIKDDTNGILYRIVPEQVKPLENQPPHAEGMLAVYRPIEESHQGTEDDPIPWVYGMDCFEGQYYSNKGHLYKVAVGGTMAPCIWEPGSPGVWQWEQLE